MRMQTAAQVMFASFVGYWIGGAKSLFGSDSDIDRPKKPKVTKQRIGTRRVIHTGPGPYRRMKLGPQSKAAKKEYRKLTHVKGYYAKQRKGELIV